MFCYLNLLCFVSCGLVLCCCWVLVDSGLFGFWFLGSLIVLVLSYALAYVFIYFVIVLLVCGGVLVLVILFGCVWCLVC